MATGRWPGVADAPRSAGCARPAPSRTRCRGPCVGSKLERLQVDRPDDRRRRCRPGPCRGSGPTGPYQAIRLPVNVIVAVAPALRRVADAAAGVAAVARRMPRSRVVDRRAPLRVAVGRAAGDLDRGRGRRSRPSPGRRSWWPPATRRVVRDEPVSHQYDDAPPAAEPVVERPHLGPARPSPGWPASAWRWRCRGSVAPRPASSSGMIWYLP